MQFDIPTPDLSQITTNQFVAACFIAWYVGIISWMRLSGYGKSLIAYFASQNVDRGGQIGLTFLWVVFSPMIAVANVFKWLVDGGKEAEPTTATLTNALKKSAPGDWPVDFVAMANTMGGLEFKLQAMNQNFAEFKRLLNCSNSTQPSEEVWHELLKSVAAIKAKMDKIPNGVVEMLTLAETNGKHIKELTKAAEKLAIHLNPPTIKAWTVPPGAVITPGVINDGGQVWTSMSYTTNSGINSGTLEVKAPAPKPNLPEGWHDASVEKPEVGRPIGVWILRNCDPDKPYTGLVGDVTWNGKDFVYESGGKCGVRFWYYLKEEPKPKPEVRRVDGWKRWQDERPEIGRRIFSGGVGDAPIAMDTVYKVTSDTTLQAEGEGPIYYYNSSWNLWWRYA